MAGKADEQQLQADEHEQHGVEDLVDQFPEHVHVTARGVGHGQRAAVVAHDQPGHHHGQRAREMQARGQRVATHDGGQGEQHLHLVVVDTAHQPERDGPEQQAQQQATARFMQQQFTGLSGTGRHAAGEHAQQQREDHHAHAIVEQRFPGDHQLQLARRFGGLQDAHDRDRIGGRNERTE